MIFKKAELIETHFSYPNIIWIFYIKYSDQYLCVYNILYITKDIYFYASQDFIL